LLVGLVPEDEIGRWCSSAGAAIEHFFQHQPFDRRTRTG
jgi:hypothetical protein